MDELVRHGRIRSVDLEFSVDYIGAGMARRLGLNRTSGVVVVELVEKGGAARAGLKLGDLIYEANGRPIIDIDDARIAFGALMVGDRVDMKVERGGDTVVIGFDIIELK
jgi:S1-C subfamily serine protease